MDEFAKEPAAIETKASTPTIVNLVYRVEAALRQGIACSLALKLSNSLVCNPVLCVESPLYDEIITLCLDIGELDAAVAIVADLETSGITVPDETLDRVISARQRPDNTVDDAS
ncbi:plastid transcriptionally active 3 [Actinidia rufa]|uniref:Plastid transcriptionally active 3 n=1 Tax=Actinidia rufa TaxID=165716 RepID=A0A7J0GUC9_9ERIC|nr:plastid transcriptionally active 3 [Actinidia rufa]